MNERPGKPENLLRMPDGREYPAALLDISAPGAALGVDAAPPIGSAVTVGRTAARVVRHFPGGIAVSFDDAAPAPDVGEDAEF